MDHATAIRLRQTNPWLFENIEVGKSGPSAPPAAWIDRRQVEHQTLLRRGRAHLVIGPRQTGKSSLAWAALRTTTRPLFLNMEEALLRRMCQSPAAFMADLHDLGAPIEALFLEEAQWLDQAALFVKGVVDARPTFPVIVTGSASFHLADRIRESLAGRASRHVLFPFSLEELVPDLGAASVVLDLQRSETLPRLVRRGGYPDVWLGDEPATLLAELIDAFVIRDASDLFVVDRLDAYQKLIELSARQIGNLVNVAELAALCGVSSGTVSRYLSIMEQAHVIRLMPAFSGGKRREVTSARKVYFIDNGLRNAVLGRIHAPDLLETEGGPLYENWVFTELAKHLPWNHTIRYWRSLSGAEVDFVCDFPDRRLAIEVKAGPLTRPKLPRSARSFIEAYAPQELWLLNATLEAETKIGPTSVLWRPHHRLPLELTRWQAGLR